MTDDLPQLIKRARQLAGKTGEQCHVIETHRGNREVVTAAELRKPFYMGYPNRFLFSTASKDQVAS